MRQLNSADTETAKPHRRDIFGEVAGLATRAAGGKLAFFLAVATVVIWAAFGPVSGYSDHWQIVINTGTTIVTFLMVFLIQNAQNRESKAIHVKLDELIFAMNRASNTMIDAENLTEEELDKLGRHYRGVAREEDRKLEGKIQSVGHEVEEVEQEVHHVEERVTSVENRVGNNHDT
jgi:low affinity Fe/Cu permease